MRNRVGRRWATRRRACSTAASSAGSLSGVTAGEPALAAGGDDDEARAGSRLSRATPRAATPRRAGARASAAATCRERIEEIEDRVLEG